MASRVLLQPGQIWKPAASDIPSRRILDFPEQMVSYMSSAGPAEEYVVSQSQFRRWIRESSAVLSGTEDAKSAPAIELAKKIVTLRKSFGLSQQDLAKALGLSRSAIAAMETGRTSSVTRHLPNLAELFQVPVELFLDGMANQTVTISLTADERDLIDLYRRLSTERKLDVQKYAERRARA